MKAGLSSFSQLLGCHVINCAVGNYGTDQAHLRFLQVHDNSPIVY